jgi:nitroimidazol reductase NimA-like FMN-containing flavoprotein (pyridoxamine 5'-phosphate oxidase superfamily)
MPQAERPYMPDYGVPRDLDGVLPWTWAEERLVRNKNYWLVTATAVGRPHAMPLWGVWRADEADFVFSCGARSRKARNLAENPLACVTIDDTVECVSVEGVVSPLPAAEQAAAIDRYVTKYAEPEGRAQMAEFVGSHALLVLRPERAFAVIEREEEFSTRATRWIW